MRNIEKQILLQTIDQKWREHLLTLEHLRSVVGFRGYAQRDPLNEYKTESFQLFERMLDGLRTDVSSKLARIQPLTPEQQAEIIRQLQAQQTAQQKQLETADVSAGGAAAAPPDAPTPLVDGLRRKRSDDMGQSRAATTPAPADRARSSSIATADSPDGPSPDRLNKRHNRRAMHDCLPNPAAFAAQPETPSDSGGVAGHGEQETCYACRRAGLMGGAMALFAAQAGVLPGLELGSETTSRGPAPLRAMSRRPPHRAPRRRPPLPPFCNAPPTRRNPGRVRSRPIPIDLPETSGFAAAPVIAALPAIATEGAAATFVRPAASTRDALPLPGSPGARRQSPRPPNPQPVRPALRSGCYRRRVRCGDDRAWRGRALPPRCGRHDHPFRHDHQP
jgi:hypothetical protein